MPDSIIISFGTPGSINVATIARNGVIDRGAGAILPGAYVDGAWVPTEMSEYPASVDHAAAEHWTTVVIATCKAAFAPQPAPVPTEAD